MKVLYKKCNEKPQVMDIENELSVLQELVGGYIEIYPLENNIAIICNEEGKLRDLPINFYLENRREYFNGDVIFVKMDEEDFTDLTDNDIKMITVK